MCRWYYDMETADCRTFLYGGCGGNYNKYASRKACWQQCGSNARQGRFAQIVISFTHLPTAHCSALVQCAARSKCKNIILRFTAKLLGISSSEGFLCCMGERVILNPRWGFTLIFSLNLGKAPLWSCLFM